MRLLGVRGRLLAVSAVLVAASASCGRDEAPPEPSGDPAASVAATTIRSGVRLVNSGDDPLAFAIFEREFSTRSLFAPCLDPGPTCVRLPARATVLVPFSQIGGYTAGARAVVLFTWRVAPSANGGHVASDFRSQVLRL